MEVIQLLDGEDLFHGAFEIVFEPDEMHLVFLDEYVTGPVVLIPGLSDGADIDDGLLVIDDRIDVIQLVRQVEIGLVQEYAGHVGVPHKADVRDSLEQQPDFERIRINIIGKDIFIYRASGRSMDEVDRCRALVDFMLERPPHRQLAQEAPASIAGLGLFFGFQDFPGPETGLFGAVVKIRRLVENRIIMVAQNAPLAPGDNQIEAFSGIGAVTDDVAQAINRLHTAFLDIRQDRR